MQPSERQRAVQKRSPHLFGTSASNRSSNRSPLFLVSASENQVRRRVPSTSSSQSSVSDAFIVANQALSHLKEQPALRHSQCDNKSQLWEEERSRWNDECSRWDAEHSRWEAEWEAEHSRWEAEWEAERSGWGAEWEAERSRWEAEREAERSRWEAEHSRWEAEWEAERLRWEAEWEAECSRWEAERTAMMDCLMQQRSPSPA